MRIAIVNPPYRSSVGPGEWITVPPQGYGAIQWVCAHLIDALLARGHEIHLLGAPGSAERHGLTVTDACTPAMFEEWAANAEVDLIHDHSNGLLGLAAMDGKARTISTHHLTGPPRYPVNCVYVSRSQRAEQAGPVIPLPVDLGRYVFSRNKGGYLLFIGRVSAHKGAYEAAAFAKAASRRLVLAGPSWEPEYLARIKADFGDDVVQPIGEIGGAGRLRLISHAAAVLVLSQPVPGPWGHLWREPGATVVSEAAASGTPVVATRNGCLPEIIDGVGKFVQEGADFHLGEVARLLSELPSPDDVRRVAEDRWDHSTIGRRYEDLYQDVLDGRSWGQLDSNPFPLDGSWQR
jgi:glycosyltransferase involved in cell wall biosynthesis